MAAVLRFEEAGNLHILVEHSTVDAILESARASLKADYAGYRNHVYRVLNFCRALQELDEDSMEKLAIAGAFHDLGIWTSHTFDYLGPSCALAMVYLKDHGLSAWSEEIENIIELHHKISAAGEKGDLAELFRLADNVDVSLGMRRHEVSRETIIAVQKQFPDHGFHMRLALLALKRLVTHPLNPLPMVKP